MKRSPAHIYRSVDTTVLLRSTLRGLTVVDLRTRTTTAKRVSHRTTIPIKRTATTHRPIVPSGLDPSALPIKVLVLFAGALSRARERCT